MNKEAYIEVSIAAYKLGYAGISDDELRRWAERDYEKALSNFKVYDSYSQFDDWTISEADEPGSGRLRGSSYTLTDHNVFLYWVRRFYDDDYLNKSVDKFGKEPLVELTEADDHSLILYQDSIDKIKEELIPGGLVAADGTTKDLNGGDWGIVDENGLHTGYFYISYYDTTIGVPESFDFDLRENHDQENALQLDYLPSSIEEWVHKSETPMWCANVFTLEKDMRIDEVATRFALRRDVPLTGFTVTFDIYRLNDGSEAPDDGELLASPSPMIPALVPTP